MYTDKYDDRPKWFWIRIELYKKIG